MHIWTIAEVNRQIFRDQGEVLCRGGHNTVHGNEI